VDARRKAGHDGEGVAQVVYLGAYSLSLDDMGQ
jgi:hypothetical protein